MLAEGDILGARYRLDDRIASGGMGDVWRATDTVLGRRVAVKLLHVRRADDPGFKERFRHEARAMAMLHHPGVADVYDYGDTKDGHNAYIVMAFIDGQPLNQRIAEAGRLDPAQTMAIVAQAARALHAAHSAGIVHRDVKPGNLIIQPDGTAVLVDFGVARSANSVTVTDVNEVVGTALYIAPEQVSKEPTGPATDLYALGAVAYHCLAGHPPFMGGSPLAVAVSHLNDDPPPLPSDVPAPVRDVVTTAMAKNPADRFPSAAAMADAATAAGTTAGGAAAGAAAGDTAVLAAADVGGDGGTGDGSGDPTVALPKAADGAAAAGTRSRRPSRRTVAASAAVLLALVLGGVLFALLGPGGQTPGPADAPPSPQVGSSASADAGRSGDADEDTTGPTGRPTATPTAPAGGPADPTDPGSGGEEPTPPAEEPTPEPTGPEPAPTGTANQGAPPPTPAASGQPPPGSGLIPDLPLPVDLGVVVN